MTRTDRRVAVVGGGIAGLVAAYDLGRAGHAVTLFEATDRPGGKLWSPDLLGHPVDAGADAFLARVPYAVDLCRELGLEDEVVVPAQRAALIHTGGRTVAFPTGLVLGVPTDLDVLSDSGVVSAEGVARAAEDLDRPMDPIEGDRTVGSLVRDRLGDEVFETLVSPLLSGINAGDADNLSLEAGAPQILAAARTGSLIGGARAQRAAGDPERPVFNSLHSGTGRLVEVLLDRIRSDGSEIRTGAPTAGVDVTTRGDGRPAISLITATGPTDPFDGLVIATPAAVTSRLLDAVAPAAAGALAALEYASVAVVTFVVARGTLDGVAPAAGVLVPAAEGHLTTACSFGSWKWPHWCDDDTAILRVSAGRHGDGRALALDNDALMAALAAELGPILDVEIEPQVAQVTRWIDALPQYRPGHFDRVDQWNAELRTLEVPIALAGASQRGVGIPACIDSGRTAARQIAHRLDS